MKATTIAVEDNHGKLVLYATYCLPYMVITEEQFEIFFNSLGPGLFLGLFIMPCIGSGSQDWRLFKADNKIVSCYSTLTVKPPFNRAT